MESAGFLVFLRGRDTVEPLEETRQGGACGGGAGGGGRGRKEGSGYSSSLMCRRGVLQGGRVGGGGVDGGFRGKRGRDLRELKTNCFCRTQRAHQRFPVDAPRF